MTRTESLESVFVSPLGADWTVLRLLEWIGADDARCHDVRLRAVLEAVDRALDADSSFGPFSPLDRDGSVDRDSWTDGDSSLAPGSSLAPASSLEPESSFDPGASLAAGGVVARVRSLAMRVSTQPQAGEWTLGELVGLTEPETSVSAGIGALVVA